MTDCALALSRCVGWDIDCRALPWDLVPRGVASWEPCARHPWSPLADEAWRLAKAEAVAAYLAVHPFSFPWDRRDVAACDRNALALASTTTWLEAEGLQRCKGKVEP